MTKFREWARFRGLAQALVRHDYNLLNVPGGWLGVNPNIHRIFKEQRGVYPPFISTSYFQRHDHRGLRDESLGSRDLDLTPSLTTENRSNILIVREIAW